MNFQQIIFALESYWSNYGCIIDQPYDMEVGAGTMAPTTMLRVLGPEPWNVGYVQPSRRPQDGRYGENPYRFYRFFQYQVILKPSPEDVQELYLESLKHLGINPKQHDIRYMEDDWESPTLGAAGVGWQVWLDGLEITQFTYFQVVGGMELPMISVEITYGLERIAMALQGVNHYTQIKWNDDIKFAEITKDPERDWALYNFDLADVEILTRQFQDNEQEVRRLMNPEDRKPGEPAEVPVMAAYELVLRCSHLFNLLDARGALSVRERAAYIGRVRSLARLCAQSWMTKREALGYPLIKKH